MAAISTLTDSPSIGSHEASIWRLVSNRSKEIVAITPNGVGPAFYCIHSVAGDVTGYFELARLLGPEFAFFGVQVPKKKMVARSVESIEMLATRYARVLTKFQPDGPLVVGGFSAGAIIALEVAQQLRLLGREVPLLIAIDGAPSNVRAGINPRTPRYLYHLALNAIQTLKDVRPKDVSIRQIGQRISDRLLCRTRLKIPWLRHSQTLDLMAMLNVHNRPGWQPEYKLFMRAMYEAMYAYVPVPYAGSVVVYELERQPLFHLRQIGAVWLHLASDCKIVRLRGRHGEFFVAQTLGPMVAHLQQALRKVRHDRKPAQIAAGLPEIRNEGSTTLVGDYLK